MSSAEELRPSMDKGWEQLLAMVAALKGTDLDRPLGDGWPVKVHLAHISDWERSLLGILRKGSRGEWMSVPDELWNSHDTDAINAFMAERAAAMTWAEVIEGLHATHAQLVATMDGLTADDLTKPYSHYQPDDPPFNPNPVGYWVAGNTFGHYEEHIGWLRAGLSG